jgi:hypothetical protein
MGSIMSAIRDDEDDYRHLCKKHGEKPQELYSIHNRWLEAKDSGKTTKSFKEYEKEANKKIASNRISTIENEIKKLKSEMFELKKQLNKKYEL